MSIVGIAGKAHHGKDTLGRTFVRNGYTRLAFADALKDACKIIFGFTAAELDDAKKEEVDPFWGMTRRSILQRVGTDCFRDHFSEDIWVKVVERKIRDMLSKDPNARIVITDVRFQNEADMIRRLGGVVLKVVRYTNAHKKTASQHASETQDIVCDRVIDNNHRGFYKNRLYAQVQDLIT